MFVIIHLGSWFFLLIWIACFIPDDVLGGLSHRRLVDVLNSQRLRRQQGMMMVQMDDDIFWDDDNTDNNYHDDHDEISGALTVFDVKEDYILQRLDHFAPSEGRHFRQRFFSSKRFVSESEQQQKIEITTTTSTTIISTTSDKQQPSIRQKNYRRPQSQQQLQQTQTSSRHPPSLAFLCVGGEGPALDKSVLVDSVHCSGDMLELAQYIHKEYNISVYLFALEHRYYGKSYPCTFFLMLLTGVLRGVLGFGRAIMFH